MSRVRVLDTGVLIGIVVAQDQHHADCIGFVLPSDVEAYATRTAAEEFESKLAKIRHTLSRQIREHRRDVIRQMGDKPLNRTDIVRIREDILNADFEAHRFLYEFYQRIAEEGEIERDELTDQLSDMAMEVYDDGAKEYGGFQSLVSAWTRGVDSYPKVERQLLVCEGDDPDVCVEAHHIAETEPEPTELGTTNPKHFIRHRQGESESRKDNILRVTALEDVVDLSMSRYP